VHLGNQAFNKLDEHLPPCGGGWEGGEKCRVSACSTRSLNIVITRFMRVIQQPSRRRVLGAMDIAPLDCPDKPGNDGVWDGWMLPPHPARRVDLSPEGER
jgi:hypothetical protein